MRLRKLTYFCANEERCENCGRIVISSGHCHVCGGRVWQWFRRNREDIFHLVVFAIIWIIFVSASAVLFVSVAEFFGGRQ